MEHMHHRNYVRIHGDSDNPLSVTVALRLHMYLHRVVGKKKWTACDDGLDKLSSVGQGGRAQQRPLDGATNP